MTIEETYFITGCARCGGDHEATFKPLTNPIVTTEVTFQWWAPCPVNGEPIVMCQVDDVSDTTAVACTLPDKNTPCPQ